MEAVPFYVDLHSSSTLVPPAVTLGAAASVTHYAGVAWSPQWPMGLDELYGMLTASERTAGRKLQAQQLHRAVAEADVDQGNRAEHSVVP
jgi:hypothetical protein